MPDKWQEKECRLRIEPRMGVGGGAAPSELVREALMIQAEINSGPSCLVLRTAFNAVLQYLL